MILLWFGHFLHIKTHQLFSKGLWTLQSSGLYELGEIF